MKFYIERTVRPLEENKIDKNSTDYSVIVTSKPDDNTIVLTTQELAEQWLKNAMSTYDPANKMYGTYLNETGTAPALTLQQIDTLADGAQSDVQKILQINAILRKEINANDIIGMVVQSISNNINTGYKISYKNFGENKSKVKTLGKVMSIINDFNDQVNIEQFICDSILTAYTEGTFMCLLKNDNENWQINNLPLGTAEMSGYTQHGNPIILINIQTLKDALRKTILKDKKGKALIFKDTEEEIKNIYNEDVYKAFSNKDAYARLDTAYTGTVRVNNMTRKYGLSPLFRALKSSIMLSNFDKADEITAKSRAKKIIHQKLRKELLGQDGTKRDFEIMAYSHNEFMKAFKNNTVVITSNAGVESIQYVEPKVEDTNVEKVNVYRNKILSSLGVSFLANDKSQTASTANISLKQLLQCINNISKQVETVIKNFYRTVLEANNIGVEYLPNIKIIDSEMLEMNMRMELSKLLYTTFNCSMDTTLNMVGIDLDDEKVRREKENEDKLDEIFKPRITAFTNSGAQNTDKVDNGRPKDKESNDPNKQDYDTDYNQDGRVSK